MKTTFNIGFVCRKSKITKAGKAPVEMSIIINGKRTYLVLPRKENPDEFKRLVNAKRRNDLKDYLETVYQRVMERQTEMVQKGISVTVQSLKDYLVHGCSDSYTIGDLFDEYLSILRKRVGVDITPLHYQKFEVVRDAFYRHISKDKQVAEINNGVIRSFFATQATTHPFRQGQESNTRHLRYTGNTLQGEGYRSGQMVRHQDNHIPNRWEAD